MSEGSILGWGAGGNEISYGNKGNKYICRSTIELGGYDTITPRCKN